MAPLIFVFSQTLLDITCAVNTCRPLRVLAGCTRNSKLLPGRPAMPRKTLLLTFYVLLGCCLAISSHTSAGEAHPVYSDLTAHEWGTFTSIAGKDGNAVEWLPLTGSTDLPSFVEHFRNAGFKQGLRGTIRMETPVLYFYSTHDVTLSVRVDFAKGLMTEWYPHANAPAVETPYYDAGLYE